MEQKRIYLGCGRHRLDGWYNLDINPSVAPGVIGWEWGQTLPFSDGEVDLALIQHSLVFCRKEYMPEVFREIARVTKPGGKLVVKEEDSRRYVWRQPGRVIPGAEGGRIQSINPIWEVTALMEAAGYTISQDDATERYRPWLNRINRIGTKIYLLEGTLMG